MDKLGFELRADHEMGKFRWVTVSPKSQPDLEIVLMPVDAHPKLDEEGRENLRKLLRTGMMPGAVLQTSDCRKTYEELTAKDVEFRSEPKEQFYGIEALFRDPAGNWFSLTQPRGR